MTLSNRLRFLLLASLLVCAASAQTTKRLMEFADVLSLRSVGGRSISTDGKHMVFALNTPDWKTNETFSDIWVVDLDKGISSLRQMTFTKKKNESSPRWCPGKPFFAFLSNREAPESKSSELQIFTMSPSGGEARKLTDAKDGVQSCAFSKDGSVLVFVSGKEQKLTLWSLPVAGFGTAEPKKLTAKPIPISWWQIAPDGKTVYFTAPDSVNTIAEDRKEKKADVTVKDEPQAPVYLWSLTVANGEAAKLAPDSAAFVSAVTVSHTGRWLGFRKTPNDRYFRNSLDGEQESDLYLYDVEKKTVERLTDNTDCGESPLSFSPDDATVAFSAADDYVYFRNSRIYVRATAGTGQAWKKIGTDFDGDLGVDFWSADGKTIYADADVGATTQICGVPVDGGAVRMLTSERGVLSTMFDELSGVVLISVNRPEAPSNLFACASRSDLGKKSAWIQCTSNNPQIDSIAIGTTELLQYRSTDGVMAEGVLVKPVGFEKGKRYPLVIQIHGGPASATQLSFQGSTYTYSNVLAGKGYVCFLPNYRGSSNYGEKFKNQISGDYFTQAFEDIMAGVDKLIADGIVDSSRMCCMGWSAGGHWSDYILTHSRRFKAISTGAGAVNWISMYAQTDAQRVREFYFKGTPYDNAEHFWNESVLKYIKNASTPTLIHCVDGDPRVPRPQSDELYMALKKLHVPVEYIVYPGKSHGIPDMRHQYIKMVAEYNWFEYNLGRRATWMNWKEILPMLGAEEKK